MELKLNTKNIKALSIINEAIITQEETGEVIVPDILPDIESIIETKAYVLLKSKEAEQGRAVIKGTLQTTVLYLSKNNDVCKLDTAIPYTIIDNNNLIDTDCLLKSEVLIIACDAITANPRKVIVRVNIKSTVSSFRENQYDICEDIENASICRHKNTNTYSVLTEYKEKIFVISDELHVDYEDCEILLYNYTVENCEYSISGSKIILRGTAVTELTVIPSDSVESEKIHNSSEFSQIIDIDDIECFSEIKLSPMMTGCYCDYNAYSSDGSEYVSVEIHTVIQCEIYSYISVAAVDDVYSLQGDVVCEWEEVRLNCAERNSVHISNLKSAVIEVDDRWEKTPSAVLYRANAGESLWDIAKKYLSTKEIICAVNGLEADIFEEEIMIIIPKA